MKELLPQIRLWIQQKKPFAIARVIQTWGSSPRPVGSALIISANQDMAGSVSGGCVEGSVIRESQSILQGNVSKMLSYGVSDSEAWAVGLTCGGKVDVFLQAYPQQGLHAVAWDALWQSLASNIPCAFVTTLQDGTSSNTFITADGKMTGEPISEAIARQATGALDNRKHLLLETDQYRIFIQVFPRRNRLLIIGAAHITADLVQLARFFDFETTVIDPRGAFTDKTRFHEPPDQIIEKYPSEVLNEFDLDSGTYAVILSHDPKIDDDALKIILRSKVAYIGALGSKKTHEKRIARLKMAGFTEKEIQRIESPIGMPIQAQGAREIALSIMGSLIRVRNQSVDTN